MIEKQQASDFDTFLIGLGNWIRPENTVLAMAMQDSPRGESNAKRGSDDHTLNLTCQSCKTAPNSAPPTTS